MGVLPAQSKSNDLSRFKISRYRKMILSISASVLALSFFGFAICWTNPSIGAPLRPGLDFTGGTQIQLERVCGDSCSTLQTIKVEKTLRGLKQLKNEKGDFLNLSGARVQLLDRGKSLVLRLPFLSASQSKEVITAVSLIAGPFQNGGQSIDTIGPSLGGQLLKSSLISLLVAFTGIAFYISVRYDKRFALLALTALAHDVIIVCGLFAWFGQFINLEVDSLFAVSILTIAGYSVNDTVVIFDRIREYSRKGSSLSVKDQVDRAISATLTRTLYTSGTTLLPLLGLIFFGGVTLYWFAIALAIGVVVGSWSSIALAPSLLTLFSKEDDSLIPSEYISEEVID